MTRPKESQLASCQLFPPGEGGKAVVIEWIDSGSERVAARITKALKRLGHEAKAESISANADIHQYCRCADEEHRHCRVISLAPPEVVAMIAARHFLDVKMEPPEPPSQVEILGTVLDLL